MSDQEWPAGEPEFSIVIPSRDRPKQLDCCLESISRLETPRDQFEVIVVDDGSREPYDAILARHAGQLAVRLLRRDGGGGPGQARNAGAAVARGRFLALTDDDCMPAPDWLTRLGEALRRHPAAIAGGRTVNSLTQNVYAEASQTLLAYLYAYYHADGNPMRFFASCNFALSAELFTQSGGFAPRFRLAGGEDRDFCDRWITAGRPTVYVPDAVVHHAHALSLAGFLRQHYTYGRGAWHYHQARAERGREPVPVEPLRFLAGMLNYPFRQTDLRRPLAVSLLIAGSVVMNVLGYFRERFASARGANTAKREST